MLSPHANHMGLAPRWVSSEWIPGRALSEFQIADVEPQTRADPGADRNHINIVVDERRHAKAADEIGRAINPAEAAKDRARRGQIIDKHHGAIAVRSGIETKRGALPKNLQIAGVARIHHALAIAQAADEGTARLLAQHIAIGLAPALCRGLDNLGKSARDRPKEAMAVEIG